MTAILPAGCLFNNRTKIEMQEIGKEWATGTVLVMEKPNGSIGFIAGSAGDYGVKIGSTFDCYHDQTGARMGYWKVLDQIKYKMVDGEFTVTESLSAKFALNTKGTIAVFK